VLAELVQFLAAFLVPIPALERPVVFVVENHYDGTRLTLLAIYYGHLCGQRQLDLRALRFILSVSCFLFRALFMLSVCCDGCGKCGLMCAGMWLKSAGKLA
jgi:hypothetical protein